MQEKRTASVMGAAETRALWQRMASSRCCVQEDMKRAPKLACCQQHSSLDPETSTDDNLPSGSFSFGDASYFSADTKWWLKGSTGHSSEEELENPNPRFMNALFEDIKFKKMQEFVDLAEETGTQGKPNEMCIEPWWKTMTDKDEMALLVATKPLDHIQNCDLPPPQRVHNTQRPPSLCFPSTSPIREKGFQESVKVPWKQGVLGETANMESGFDKSRSYSSRGSKKDSPKSSPGNDLNRAQLLEALHHSQTRAREAEEAAREACTERDRIVTVLFRQANQLFAYKQWFQLEVRYLQMKNKEKQSSGRNPRKRRKKGKVERYVVAFALGFSLIGAGLLLGWTLGWLAFLEKLLSSFIYIYI